MTLKCLEFDFKSVAPPDEIANFLRAVEPVVEHHRVSTSTQVRGFVPGNYAAIYSSLKAVHDSHLLCGNRFCEWGSGVGVVSSLAGMVGFEAYGIECDENLCRAANGIRDDFEVPVTFVQGSYIPEGVEDLVDDAFATQEGELSLQVEPDDAYDELGLDIDDFDLIFIYPWPNDVELTHAIFDRYAARGALLLAYYCNDSIALYRKK